MQAENFDGVGQNVAYRDTSGGNSGAAYRQTDVDNAVTTDTGGGYNVGYTRVAEWLRYTVDVATTRSYTVRLRYARTSDPPPRCTSSWTVSTSRGPLVLQDAGGGIPAVGVLDRHPDDRASLEIHGVLGLVRQGASAHLSFW